jgi:hypothetical protein
METPFPGAARMESQSPQGEPVDPLAVPVGAARQARTRHVLRASIAIFLILLSAFAFLPAFLSSPLGRPLLLGYVNRQLNGRAQIRHCSLGWFSGMRIDGLVIFDINGRQILQASRVTSGLRFLNLLRGDLHCGRVQIDGLDLLISRQENGLLNWQSLVRPDSPWRSPGLLASITGELFVSDASATFEDHAGGLAVYLRSINAFLKLEPWAPIDDKLDAQARIGSGRPGTLVLTHLIAAGDKVRFLGTQRLITRDLDPSIVSQRLGPAWKLLSASKQESTFETNVRP